jgi:molybdopterin-guanine dinucleotide biosynthesis protein A
MAELKKNKEKWEWIFPCEYTTIRVFSGKKTICIVDNIDDAMVIVDAGNVHNETGLTPRQLLDQVETCTEENQALLEQRDELLSALKKLTAESEDSFENVNARKPQSFSVAIYEANQVIDRMEGHHDHA